MPMPPLPGGAHVPVSSDRSITRDEWHTETARESNEDPIGGVAVKASGQERAFQRVASIERMNDHAGIDGGEGDPAADVSVELELPERDLHRDLPYRDGRHDEALTGLLRLDDGTSTARQARRIGDPPNPGTRVENDHFSRAFQSRSRGASKSGAMRTTDPRSEYPAPPVAPGDPAGTIRT